MPLIKEKIFNQELKGKEFVFEFELEKEGIYGIEILASAKSWWQNLVKLKSFFKDDDLTVIVDNISFPKKSKERGLFNGEIAFNGNNLKGLKKTDFFILKLNKGLHKIKFLIDQSPYLEFVRIYRIEKTKISFLPKDNLPPEDGNRRQWLTIILVNLGLKNLKITASAKEGKKFLFFKRDDSDLKLIINGKIQKNQEPKSHKYWYWCGRTLKGKEKTFEKELNLPPTIHYIELWADRSPEIEKIIIQISFSLFGKISLYPDITTQKFVNIRREPFLKEGKVLFQLTNEARMKVIKERVRGEFVPGKSYIWHKIRWQGKEGYVLSSFVEIEGQEREIVVGKIREKAKELKMDENLVLALAGCESRFKPYATSAPFELKDKSGKPLAAKGVFQLTKEAVLQLEKNKGIYHFSVRDCFDVGQNIEGGVRYLKWLYDTYYKGKPQEVEKLVAAYNAGQSYIPPDLSLNYPQIPSEKKREEAKRLVRCVLENRKRKNWKKIVYVLVFLLILGFGTWSLNQIDFFEPKLSEKEYLLSRVSQFPAILWKEEKDELIFFDSQGKIVREVPVKNFNFDQIFQFPEKFQKTNSIYIWPQVLEHPENVFYFLVSNSWSCGQNCHWVFLKYDLKKNKTQIIDADVFGEAINFYPSPNFQKIALISYVFGGFCNSKTFLEVIDLKGHKKEKISGFQDENYLAENIESLEWEGNETIKIVVSRGCHKFGKPDQERTFLFHF